MVAEEACVGTSPGARVRDGQTPAGEGGECGRADGERHEQGGSQGRTAEDEPTKVREGRRHGRALVPERGQRAAQPNQQILLRTYLRELHP